MAQRSIGASTRSSHRPPCGSTTGGDPRGPPTSASAVAGVTGFLGRDRSWRSAGLARPRRPPDVVLAGSGGAFLLELTGQPVPLLLERLGPVSVGLALATAGRPVL